jgi:hypothetical protein
MTTNGRRWLRFCLMVAWPAAWFVGWCLIGVVLYMAELDPQQNMKRLAALEAENGTVVRANGTLDREVFRTAHARFASAMRPWVIWRA